jgi:hypothetical protein
MDHKYGFHANRSGEDVFDAIRRIKPKVIKCLDPNVGFWTRVRGIHPDVFLIGRLYAEHQDFKDAPTQRGRDFAERILRLEANQAAVGGRRLFDAWESYNEVMAESASPDEKRAYDEFQVAFGERLRSGGFEPIAMNFGTGNMLGPDFLNYFRGTLETYRYLGFHEYDWPAMWRLHEQNIREKNEGGMWLTLRYRRIMNEVRRQFPGRHTVIITECGMTQGVQGREDVGWRAEPAVPEESYWESLLWYNSELMKDDYVMAACLFVVGTESAKWTTFENLGGIVDRLERFQATAALPKASITFARPAASIGVTAVPADWKSSVLEAPPVAFGVTEGGGDIASRTCRVGVHGRNQEDFADRDFEVIRQARLEAVKMMSQTRPAVFERIKRENPDAEIITRLHDDRINSGGHPSPGDFAARMVPILAALRPYCAKFQVANEPNHAARYEGWGSTDDDARNFNGWFLEVYDQLKQAHPWAKIGFPGLAVPDFAHRDHAWLGICGPAIQRADWLGVHCYWQTPPDRPSVMLDEAFGLTFKYYHQQYPNKVLEILECGNSNIQRPPGDPWPISPEAVAGEYVTWLREVFKYPYINSASFFILSSQDAAHWSFFSWRTEDNWVKPVVSRIRDMQRPAYQPASAGAPVPSKPPAKPPVKPIPLPAGLTNQIVINALNRASLKLGMGNWGLVGPAGLSLNALVSNRNAAYAGPGLDDMPKLTPEQRQAIREQLPAGISFAAAEMEMGFLKQSEDLALTALGLPAAQRIRLASLPDAAGRRAARVWNRFGFLLLKVADRLGLGLPVAVAVVAAEADRPGIAGDGRLVIRFENHIFYSKWGDANQKAFQQHFAMDPARPWLRHQWRPEAAMAWRNVRSSQAEEWGAYECAASLDRTAAQQAVSMGFPGISGAAYDLLGYESAGQMFDAFATGERYQLLGHFDLIAGPNAASRRVEALRQGDLEAFATLHYGPRQAALHATILRQAAVAFERLDPTARGG